LVALMLGRSRDTVQQGTTAFHASAGPRTAAAAEPLLRVEALEDRRRLRGVSLEVRRGEVLGLAGLLGSGRTATARAIFGADPAERGTVRVDGQPFTPKSPRHAIRAGIAFVPEDRKAEGIIPELSVRENITLAAL